MTLNPNDPTFIEWYLRIWKLMEPPRSMTYRAARTVVDAAMYGIGCTEGEVRTKIEEAKRDNHEGVSA